MPYTFDYLVFIGRFQPFHLAHMQTIKIALEQSENVILALGSAQNERNTKNPFLASEREEMILSNFSEAHQKRIHFVHVIDVYNDEVKNMDGLKDKILRQRAISIEKLKEAKNVGIIIEIKPGQKFGSPKFLIDKLKEKGKNPIVITMSELTPDKIMNFYNIDAFIELACPRIAIDDFAKYPRPILTFKEALVALGTKSWDEILKIGIV